MKPVRITVAAAAWAAASVLSLGVAAQTHADVFANVPATELDGYQLAYTLAVPTTANFNTTAPVYTNPLPPTGPFDRIAYYMELKTSTGSLRYAYASMDAFTQDGTKIAIPTVANGGFFQQNVRNMNVYSNAGIATGVGLSGGNIEFWPSNYAAPNIPAVPNASGTTYDFGDQVTSGGYGSFQIHNHATGTTPAGQTILAYSRFGSSGSTASDIGIGTNTTVVASQNNQINPDWTFTSNVGSYTVKNIQVLVRPAAQSPLPPAIKIMALGDSITYGSMAAGGYRTRLINDLAGAYTPAIMLGSATDNASAALTYGAQTHHEGHSGYRIDQISANLDGTDNSTGNNGGNWLNSSVQPDFILLHIGTNDFGQNKDVTHAIDRLDALITKICKARPDANLIVSNLLKRTDAPTANPTAGAQIEALFNPYVPGIVANHQALGQKVTFLDLNSIINPATDLADGLHPNQQGYDKMADAWLGAIQAVPEPGSLTAMGGVAVSLLAARRRRPAKL